MFGSPKDRILSVLLFPARPAGGRRGESERGFTLIELVIIIVILGIVAGVAIPKMSSLSTSAKTTATKEEMLRIKEAIIGDPRLVSGGEYVNRGFSGDVGRLPANLEELVRQGSLPTYDKFTRVGWNGPYLDSSKDDDGYYLFLYDSWGDGYGYDSTARTIISLGDVPNGKPGTEIGF